MSANHGLLRLCYKSDLRNIGDTIPPARLESRMANHLEVPFYEDGIERNATVQFDKNGVTITIETRPSVFVEHRTVEQFVARWQEVRQTSKQG